MDHSICNYIGFNYNGQKRGLIHLIPYSMLVVPSRRKMESFIWNLFHSELLIEVRGSNL